MSDRAFWSVLAGVVGMLIAWAGLEVWYRSALKEIRAGRLTVDKDGHLIKTTRGKASTSSYRDI